MGPTRMVLGKPVIAAIEGYAVAGGLELALWCDLRVAASDAILGVFCRRWGVPLIDGGTVRLPAIIGYGRALELILSGREVAAAEAGAIGLVNRVVGPGEALENARAWAAQLAALPQTCLRSDRAALRAAWGVADEAAALAIELAHGRTAIAEMVAGVQRFRDGAGRHGGPVDRP
jgi:enoyl-CoA hydratase